MYAWKKESVKAKAVHVFFLREHKALRKIQANDSESVFSEFFIAVLEFSFRNMHFFLIQDI